MRLYKGMNSLPFRPPAIYSSLAFGCVADTLDPRALYHVDRFHSGKSSENWGPT